MKENFPIAGLVIAAMLVGLSGCAQPGSPTVPSDAKVETGRITGKKLVATLDQPSSPASAGIGGGAIGGSGFGGVGLGFDLSRLFGSSGKKENVYEYELTTTDHQVLKIHSNVELKEGDCARPVVSDQQGQSSIAASPAC